MDEIGEAVHTTTVTWELYQSHIISVTKATKTNRSHVEDFYETITAFIKGNLP